MLQIICRQAILFIVLTSINIFSYAAEVKGYIINENSDTIYGTIKLREFDQITGGFIINGFDIESLNYNVSFRSNAQKSFKLLLPGMISGFSFTYDSVDYTFKRFLLEYNSIIVNEEKRYRFLQLVYQGNLELYQNTICINNPSSSFLNNKYLTYYEFFLYHKSKGLLKVESTKQIKTMRDLFLQFNIDNSFIQEIPENTNFKDIKVILDRYDKWLRVSSFEFRVSSFELRVTSFELRERILPYTSSP